MIFWNCQLYWSFSIRRWCIRIFRFRSQNFDTSISSEEDNSEDIEYDDGDDNAAVAGADEADSVGETEDTVGELQGLQDVQQVSW